jgi:hypothetical protein
MKLIAFASIVLAVSSGNEGLSSTLTFDDAVALARKTASPAISSPLRSELAGLRRSVLPTVRAEVTANTSRTLDLFAEGPLEVRYAQSVLAFDYPLWGAGSMASRINAVEARLRRLAGRGGLDDARFAQLLDAFGDLYLAQRQSELLRPLFEQLSNEANRSALLISSGEISNLTATEWREIALSFGSRLLDLDARRIDAAAKLRLITGVAEEPTLVLDLDFMPAPAPELAGAPLRDDRVDAMTIAVEESRARLHEVSSTSAFRAILSGFAGIGAAQSSFRDITSDGSFGVYGLRIHLSYPIIGGSSAVPAVEAGADLAQTLALRDEALDVARARASEYRLREESARKRISLMRQSVALAKEREQSLVRLVSGGLRSQSDLGHAQAERTRRETDLLAVEIERWKAAQMLARMTRTDDPDQP